MADNENTGAIRRTVLLVAVLNFAYFFVEFFVARKIGSVSLFADSVDFLEDASVNLLILIAIAWSARSKARLGMALAVILLIPGLATAWTVWENVFRSVPPDPNALIFTGFGALVVNLTCAFMLARFRKDGGSLTTAAFLSARNDGVANIAIVLAGSFSANVWHSPLPDLLVGIGIAFMNIDAAREVLAAARNENRVAAQS